MINVLRALWFARYQGPGNASQPIGIFSPERKVMAQPDREVLRTLAQIIDGMPVEVHFTKMEQEMIKVMIENDLLVATPENRYKYTGV